ACNGVDHLLMKAWVRFARVEPAVHRDQRIIQVHRVIKTIPRRIVVHDSDALTDGTRSERLVAHEKYADIAWCKSEVRTERIDLQASERRRATTTLQGRRRLRRPSPRALNRLPLAGDRSTRFDAT